MSSYIEEAEKALLHTYNRYQVVFEKGEGVHLYDMDGKEYLDFVSGIAVFALGYQNQEYNDALKAQIDKIIHTSNYYYNIPELRRPGSLRKFPVWTGFSLQTAVRNPLKGLLRRPENMRI